MFENATNFGQRIRSIRMQLGDTLKEFGERFNPIASHSLVSRWERNINKPNEKRIKTIAKLGNVSVEYLKTGIKSFSDMTDDEQETRLNKMSENIEKQKDMLKRNFNNDLLTIIKEEQTILEITLIYVIFNFNTISDDNERRVLSDILRTLNEYKDVANKNVIPKEEIENIKQNLLYDFENLVAYRLGLFNKL